MKERKKAQTKIGVGISLVFLALIFGPGLSDVAYPWGWWGSMVVWATGLFLLILGGCFYLHTLDAS